ncbi:GIY-YIG nuclease family protein [Bacillus toyonensis]|uniref:GIY-YIG nuclease family protein n=1 Tax=Bacillus toyonensis TaxID=155322 RepID=UPI003465BC14
MSNMLPFPSHKNLSEKLIRGANTSLPLSTIAQPERTVEEREVYSTQWYYIWDKEGFYDEIGGLKLMSGVYVFKDIEDEILYVGEAQDLRDRICYEHIKGKKTSPELYRYFYKVDIYVIDHTQGKHGPHIGMGDRKTLEAILTSKLLPLHTRPKDIPIYLNKYAMTRRRDKWDKDIINAFKLAYPNTEL